MLIQISQPLHLTMTQAMNGFPPIDNDTELLIHEQTYEFHEFEHCLAQFRQSILS